MGMFDRSFHDLLNRYQSIREKFTVTDEQGNVIGTFDNPPTGVEGFKAVTKGATPPAGTAGVDDFKAVTQPGGGADSKSAAPAAAPAAAPTASTPGSLPTPEENKAFLKKQADAIRATDPERAKYIDMQAARTDQNAAVAATGGNTGTVGKVATGDASPQEKELLKKFHGSDYNPSSKTDQARLQELRNSVAASGGDISKADPEKLRAMSYAQQYKGTPQGEAYAKKAGTDYNRLVGVTPTGPANIGQAKPATPGTSSTPPTPASAPATPIDSLGLPSNITTTQFDARRAAQTGSNIASQQKPQATGGYASAGQAANATIQGTTSSNVPGVGYVPKAQPVAQTSTAKKAVPTKATKA